MYTMLDIVSSLYSLFHYYNYDLGRIQDPVQLSSVDVIAPFYQNKCFAQKLIFIWVPVLMGLCSICPV